MAVGARYIPSSIQGAVIAQWINMPMDEVGQQLYIPNHSDKTVQFYGTFGGATVSIHGSNDPRAQDDPESAVWWTLINAQGDPISKTSEGGWLILDNPLYIRSKVTGGDVSTSVNVILCAKRG